MIYIPIRLFKDETLSKLVHEYADPYNPMEWKDLYPKIKNETEVIKFLIKHGYDEKEYDPNKIY